VFSTNGIVKSLMGLCKKQIFGNRLTAKHYGNIVWNVFRYSLESV